MLLHFSYAAALVFATVFVHGACTAAVLTWLRSMEHDRWVPYGPLTRATSVAALVLLMSVAAFVESGLWAGFYVLEEDVRSSADVLSRAGLLKGLIADLPPA